MRVLRRSILWEKFTLLQMLMRDCASFHLCFSATTSGIVYSGKTLSERKTFQARRPRASTAHKIAAMTVPRRQNLAAFYVITSKDASRLLRPLYLSRDIMSEFSKAIVTVEEILVLKDACNPLYLLCELLKDLQQHFTFIYNGSSNIFNIADRSVKIQVHPEINCFPVLS